MKKPEWVLKLRRNAKARERYFMKRYGNLKRMYAIDEKLQELMDKISFEDEMKNFE